MCIKKWERKCFDFLSALSNESLILVLQAFINPFVPNAHFLYQWKPYGQENLSFLGLEKGCIGNKWVKHYKLQEVREISHIPQRVLSRRLTELCWISSITNSRPEIFC